MSPLVQPFYDPTTSTVSYVVHAGAGSACAVIDPVLDFEARSGRTATTQADRILAFIAEDRLALAWIFETHVHADHLTAARLLRSSPVLMSAMIINRAARGQPGRPASASNSSAISTSGMASMRLPSSRCAPSATGSCRPPRC